MNRSAAPIAPTPSDPSPLLAEFRAFERSLALRTAVELDLFTLIGGGTDTVAALAAATGAAERGIRILCDYLTIAGHLTKKPPRYNLTPSSATFLTTTSPSFIGAAVRFLASDRNVAAFLQLGRSVKDGGAPAAAQTIPDTAAWVAFAHFMTGLARPIADAAAAALELDANQPMQVLDIAAGHGEYGLAVLARNPKAHVYALDSQEVLEVAAGNAARADVAERYHAIPGDAFQTPFRGPYELIIAANFAHHFDRATNVVFFGKCLGALSPYGRLLLIDFVPNDDRVSPHADAAFALTMLATTAKGDAYTFGEFSGMLQEAGFEDVVHLDLGGLPRWALVASR
jgi:ubiquinone/menaquinone biosynthesis C-methylase UbiE